MLKKRVTKLIVATVILATTILLTVGGSNVQAHDGGHRNGCEEFGELASGLAGPEFGQFHRAFSPSAPGANADMVDAVGHVLCD